jgi:hypothetical protein
MTKINKTIYIKPRVNKNNKQINLSLKKKDLPQSLKDNILDVKRLKIILEEFD